VGWLSLLVSIRILIRELTCAWETRDAISKKQDIRRERFVLPTSMKIFWFASGGDRTSQTLQELEISLGFRPSKIVCNTIHLGGTKVEVPLRCYELVPKQIYIMVYSEVSSETHREEALIGSNHVWNAASDHSMEVAVKI
jgi:hypothetical protein